MLKLSNINKSYSPGVGELILKNLSLEVNEGESLSITGPSGSGKSTLLNLMGLLDVPDAGEVLFEGENLSAWNDEKKSSYRNKNIGFIFQLHHLLPHLNVLENITLPGLACGKKKDLHGRAHELLSEAGIADKGERFPEQLSGGERQRVAVLRALILEPKIILADEPTGALDEKSSERIEDLLLNINHDHGTALVMVTHSKTLANKMSKTYELREGRLS